MRASLTAFPHRGLSPHQFTPMSGAHERCGVDAGRALCLHMLRCWSGATHRERWAAKTMRHFAAVCSVVLLAAGCRHAPRGGGQPPAQVWHSPGSTLEERARAANELIPVGSTSQAIINALGTNGSLSHFHGPTLGGNPPRQLPNHDDWCVLYRFPGGGVRLELAPPILDGGRFVRATPFRTLTNATTRFEP